MIPQIVRSYSAACMPRAWSRKAYDRAAEIRRAAAGMSSAGCAHAAGSVGAISGGGGGPTTTPTYVGSGTGVNANSDPTPDYPANVAGDLFVLRVYRNGGTAPSISGWTQQGSVLGSGIALYVFTRDARATGSDSGTITITGTGAPMQAQIDCFRNVAASSFIESIVTATAGAGSSALNMPTITCTGAHRFAYAAIGSNNGAAGMASATGETGGDWQELIAEQTSGLGDGLQAQGATLNSGGTLSGGSMVLNSAQGICVAFALIGV